MPRASVNVNAQGKKGVRAGRRKATKQIRLPKLADYEDEVSSKTKRRAGKYYRKVVMPMAGTLGGALGSALVPGVGGILGDLLGRGAAAVFGNVTGMGAYKVHYNSFYHGDSLSQKMVPMMHSTKKNGFRIRHREYVKDLFSASTSAFNVQTIPICPSLPNLFPWLSTIAPNFEMYRIHGMLVEFKSNSSDALNSTNTALGTVILATQYNANNKAFVNKQQMENYQYSCSDKPSRDIVHFIECDPKEVGISEQLYCNRQGNGSNTNDLRLSDWGSFAVATVGQQGNTVNFGEIWCSYDIEFFMPKQRSNAFLLSDHYILGTGVTTSAYFGSSPSLASSSNLGTTLTGTTIVFPQGANYQVCVTWIVIGASSAITNIAMTGSNGVTVLNIANNDSQNNYQAGSITTSLNQAVYFFNVVDLNNGTLPTITFSSGTIVGTQTQGDLYIDVIQNNN